MDLEEQVSRFADEIGQLVDRVFYNAPGPRVERLGERLVVGLDGPVPLTVGQVPLAKLKISLRCCHDSSLEFLAVEKSNFVLVADVDKTPIMRFDYDRLAHSKPVSHIQVHAHRGALSHVLSRAQHKAPHSMEALHLPTGGPRFRPCLEDVVEFLIGDCGFDGRQGWRTAVKEGRENWRRYQVRSAVRDAPTEAADVLTKLGYQVTPPSNGHAADTLLKLRAW